MDNKNQNNQTSKVAEKDLKALNLEFVAKMLDPKTGAAFRSELVKKHDLKGFHIHYRRTPIALQLKGEKDVIHVAKLNLRQAINFLNQPAIRGEVIKIEGTKDRKEIISLI